MPFQPSLDPAIVTLFQQQGLVLKQNVSLISTLSSTVTPLQSKSTAQVATARDTLSEQIATRGLKDLSLVAFPKFHNNYD